MNPLIALQRHSLYRLFNASEPLLKRLAGPPVVSPDGLELEVRTQLLLKFNEKIGPKAMWELGVLKGRASMDQATRIVNANPKGVLQILDQYIPAAHGQSTIQIRVYTPPNPDRALPMIVYYHGGGFVVGSIHSHDAECKMLALEVNAIVISVQYRLAPEYRFPTAVDDGHAAFRWIARHAQALGGDPSRMAVAGDSAGGNIAAVVAMDCRDCGDAVQPAFQFLIYPCTDLTRSFESHRMFRNGFLLDALSLDWYMDHYLSKTSDQYHPRGSPLFAANHQGLPPALIITAGFDPLRDEAKAYADKLSQAGVPVQYRCYEGMIHGFFSMTYLLPEARRAVSESVGSLKQALTNPG